MAVYKEEPSRTIVIELHAERPDQRPKKVVAYRERSREPQEVIGVAEGNCRSDENVLAKGGLDLVEQQVGCEGVCSQRVVPAVLLRASYCHDDKVVSPLEVVFNRRPGT